LGRKGALGGDSGELYAPLVSQEFEAPPFLPRRAGMGKVSLVTTTLTSAEMIKYDPMLFGEQNRFANEVANICERVALTRRSADGYWAGFADRRSVSECRVGWGGSCFGKDIQSLLHTARDYGYQARMLELRLR